MLFVPRFLCPWSQHCWGLRQWCQLSGRPDAKSQVIVRSRIPAVDIFRPFVGAVVLPSLILFNALDRLHSNERQWNEIQSFSEQDWKVIFSCKNSISLVALQYDTVVPTVYSGWPILIHHTLIPTKHCLWHDDVCYELYFAEGWGTVSSDKTRRRLLAY